MRLIGLAVVVALSLTLAPLAAGAQQAGRLYQVRYALTGGGPSSDVPAGADARERSDYEVDGKLTTAMTGAPSRRGWSGSREWAASRR